MSKGYKTLLPGCLETLMMPLLISIYYGKRYFYKRVDY